jgi:FkbM family methyltransferase
MDRLSLWVRVLRSFLRNRRTMAGVAAQLSDPNGALLAGYLMQRLPRDVMRAVGVEIVARDGAVIDFERNGLRWTVDTGDEIGRELYVTGVYEGVEIAAVLEWLTENDAKKFLVDLGANVGTTSIPFALAGYDVLAVEPVPATFEMLTTNVRRNGLDGSVQCAQRAISAADGHVRMWTGFGSGQAELTLDGEQPEEDVAGARGDLIEVSSSRLDSVLAAHGVHAQSVGLVWADVQGSETAVIQTGTALWAAGVPLYLEVDPSRLAAHGGLDTFERAVCDHFVSFIPRDELVLGRPAPRPVNVFSAFVRSIAPGSYTDALFIAEDRHRG